MHATSRLILAALLLAAGPAFADEYGGLDLTVHLGMDRYDAVGLRSGLGGVSSRGRLRDGSSSLGGTAIFRRGMGELGAIGEVGRTGTSGSTTFLGVLAGPGVDLGLVRLEFLGEVGAHRYGDVLHDDAVLTRSRRDTWLVSVGARPGVSMRVGPGGSVILGVWAFGRWDVTNQDSQVTLASGGASTYKLGGAQYGAALRLGFSL